MKWLDNLKVSYKLCILGLIAIVGLLGTSISGYIGIRQTQDDINEMYESSVQSLDYAGTALSGMRYAQGMVVTMTTCRNDPQRLKDLEDKYEVGVKMVEDSFKGYDAIPIDDDETDPLMETIHGNWKDFHATLDKTANLCMAGRFDEGLAEYSKVGAKQGSVMGENLMKLTKLEHQGAVDLKAETDQNVESILRGMLGLLVLIFVVLIAVCYTTTKKITEPLQTIVKACEKMQKGDFRDTQVAVTRKDEFGQMMQGFQNMRKTVSGLMKQTNDTAQQLAASSEELTASAHQSAQASEQVAQSASEQQTYIMESEKCVSQTLDSINHLNETAKDVSLDADDAYRNASEGSKNVLAAVHDIESVADIVKNSAATVDKLGMSSKEIGSIVETISGIADQTNLLALNAAIEAARAGEYGKGFAVVADEVRKLAEASQTAAQQITKLIAGVQKDTEEAVASMKAGNNAVQSGATTVKELQSTFESIQQAAENVSDKAKEMVEDLQKVEAQTGTVQEKTKKISSNSGKVVNEMESVSAASEEQSASAGEIASASDSLAKLAQNLSGTLQDFKY